MIENVNRHIKGEIPIYKNKHRILNKNGEWIWLSASAKIIEYDKKNNPEFMIGIAIDITDSIEKEEEIKNALQKARESEKLKSNFIANISHEIRTPLNGITSLLDLMLYENKLSPEYIENIILAKNNSIHLLSIIENILKISKYETEELKIHYEYFSIKYLLDDIKQTYNSIIKNEQKNILLFLNTILFENDLIKSDPNKIKQIFYHLMDNAIKYTKQGYIEIGAFLQNEKTIVFYVKDTGIGIPKEKWKLIFKSFYQINHENIAEFGGIGLGLSFTEKLINTLDGRIWLISKEYIGTTFYFSLPYIPIKNDKRIMNT